MTFPLSCSFLRKLIHLFPFRCRHYTILLTCIYNVGNPMRTAPLFEPPPHIRRITIVKLVSLEFQRIFFAEKTPPHFELAGTVHPPYHIQFAKEVSCTWGAILQNHREKVARLWRHIVRVIRHWHSYVIPVFVVKFARLVVRLRKSRCKIGVSWGVLWGWWWKRVVFWVVVNIT